MKHLLLDNPAPLFFAVFTMVFVALRWARPGRQMLLWICGIGGGLSLCAYLIINALNINRIGLLWHDEANVLSIAAAYTRGTEMYHAVSAPAIYSLFYGPSTYLVYAPFMASFSGGVLFMRLAMFAVNLLNAWLLFKLLRLWLPRPMALGMVSVALAFLLAYTDVLLGTRGDIWLLCCVLVATLCAFGRWRSVSVSFGAGIAAGIAIDFKVTVVAVVAVLAVLFYRRHGVRAAVVFAGTAIAVALAVFALPNISLANYAAWLKISSHQRFLPSTALGNLLAAAFLLGPVVLIASLTGAKKPARGTHWLLRAAVGAAILVCVVTGSKDGAGAWHLWQMLPLALALAAEAVKATQADGVDVFPEGVLSVVASIALAGMCCALFYAQRDYHAVRPPGDALWRQKVSVANSVLHGIVAQYGSTHRLTMGEGEAVTDYRTDLRYELVQAGQVYFFDENGVVEGEKAHFALPEAAIERVLGCGNIWIVPHGEAPFSSVRLGVLPITTTPYIFPDSLRLHFTDRHAVFQQGPVYDLWKCSTDSFDNTSFNDGLHQ